jgi:NADH-quinone oxidoreductase subunit L
MNALPWIILFLPLGAAAVITLFTQRNPRLSAGLSIGAVLAGFGLSIVFIALAGWTPATPELAAKWLDVGALQVDFGLRLDSLSLLMTLVVTGVATLIHIYSWGYMHGDPGFSRFFACLSLFTFSMLGIVLANNFLQLFIFWELVGLASYLLIGFWFERPAAADAGKKAFITNRLGDFGFLFGILTVWLSWNTLNFGVLQDKAAGLQGAGLLPALAGLLIFCGAVGKSAQFPLHVWLPDAMEGPTPVSALIHAATMVAAGVYMLCRVAFLFNHPALEVISWIGGFTALLSALIAVQQDDIKRILAYSTLSQLGYMVMGVGLADPAAAMFHLTTHAFFKALLFLGAGSVILALHHEQNIWKMGGLRWKMPVTFWTFMAGTLALAGVWPFSGFFSKDALIAQAASKSHGLYILALFVAFLTAFYMFRLIFVVFAGAERQESAHGVTESRRDEHPASGAGVAPALGEHAVGKAGETPAPLSVRETGPIILWPLRILAVFSIIAGWIGVEHLYAAHFFPDEAGVPAGSVFQQIVDPFVRTPLTALLGLAAAAFGLGAAYKFYSKAAADPLPGLLGGLSAAMRNRFYFDEFYEMTVIRLHDFLAAVADLFDRWIIAGLGVRGTHGTTELLGNALRLLQTGNLQTYVFVFALGVALLLYKVLVLGG